MKNFLKTALVAGILCLAMSSCQKDDSGRAPRIPSVETVRIDLSSLPVTKAGPSSETLAGLVDVLDNIWGHIYQQLINIPVGGLEIVADAQPVRDGNVWTWKVSDYNCLGQKYEVALVGKERGNKVEWELSVSRNGLGGFQNYTWITGWSKKDGSEGQWMVSVGPGDTDVLVTSDWKAENGTVMDCRLTYNLGHAIGHIGSFFNGSYIEYINGASDNAYTNTLVARYFQIGHIEAGATVEWNYRTGACRFRFGDSPNWIEYND